MIGAIIGDIVGSRFEQNNYKAKNFDMFDKNCRFTDDSIMTISLGRAFWECDGQYNDLSKWAIKCMQELGRLYPHCGYGGNFYRWIFSDVPQPYHSFGNGAAMRVSAAGIMATSIEEARQFSYAITKVSHDDPEGLKGAESVAVSIYLARMGYTKREIKKFIEQNYYKLDFTLGEIRENYVFDVTCQGSVPQALESFFEAQNFEDAIRNAVSIGGDSDTIAAIAGSIAEAYFGVPDTLRLKAYTYFDNHNDKELLNWLLIFEVYFQGYSPENKVNFVSILRAHIEKYGTKNFDKIWDRVKL